MDMPVYHANARQPTRKQPLVLTALGTLTVAFLFWAFFLKPIPVPVVTKVCLRTQEDREKHLA